MTGKAGSSSISVVGSGSNPAGSGLYALTVLNESEL